MAEIIETVTTFHRLFLRESKNKKGERCFIGKVKNMEDGTDLIVVANPDLLEKNGITETGRYDVEVKPMKNGRGFIVSAISWAFDKIEISTEETRVVLLINGREEKLKENGRFIPLSFDCERYYDPRKISENIRKKLGYMQLEEGKDIDGFLDAFVSLCKQTEKNYKKNIDKKY